MSGDSLVRKAALEVKDGTRKMVAIIGGYQKTAAGPNIFQEATLCSEITRRGHVPIPLTLKMALWQTIFPQPEPLFWVTYLTRAALSFADVLYVRPGQGILAMAVSALVREAGKPVVQSLEDLEAEIGSQPPLVDVRQSLADDYNGEQVRLDVSQYKFVDELVSQARIQLKLRAPTVYIAGPYSSDPSAGTHAAFAIATMLLKEKIVTPWVPHWTHLLDMIRWQPYQQWLIQDGAILSRCEYGLRAPGKSSGADGEMAILEELGHTLFVDDKDGTPLSGLGHLLATLNQSDGLLVQARTAEATVLSIRSGYLTPLPAGF